MSLYAPEEGQDPSQPISPPRRVFDARCAQTRRYHIRAHTQTPRAAPNRVRPSQWILRRLQDHQSSPESRERGLS